MKYFHFFSINICHKHPAKEAPESKSFTYFNGSLFNTLLKCIEICKPQKYRVWLFWRRGPFFNFIFSQHEIPTWVSQKIKYSYKERVT